MRRSVKALSTILAAIGLTAFLAAQAQSVVHVSYTEDMATLDPAIGYDIENWPVEHALFITLLSYQNGTTLVPWAATSMPQVSQDLKTYTFHIHPGITFSDGEAVDSGAFRYAIERILDPKTQSPQGGMGGWYGNLVGAKDYIDGKTDHVAGIKTPDPLTISFTLVKPDRTFMNILATPFSSAEPQKAVEKWGRDYAHHVVGSAQFLLKSWVPGQSMVLVKNPGYFDPATAAKVDQIDFTFNLDPQVALLRAQRGEIDVIGDDIPSAQFLSVANNPKYKADLHHFTQVGINYVFMNTQVAPFDNKLVREAVNYAVDKKRIVQLMNGRGQVAQQILPPAMPGYDSSVEGTSYDPQKAKQLLTQAGHPNGIQADFITLSNPPGPQIAQALQQQMAEAGITLNIKALPHAEYINTITTLKKAAIGFSGWYQDYPDPSDFLDVLFNSANVKQGSFNLSEYQNPAVDKLMNDAQGLPVAQAMPMYQQAQKLILADYPWVPLYFPVEYKWANPSITNFTIDPVWTFVYADWGKN